MENLNAVFINDGVPQSERLIKLVKIAIQQMLVLEEFENRKYLKLDGERVNSQKNKIR